jgi:hypothetical protein
MTQCRRQCTKCEMTVTVLVESRSDCLSFSKALEAFMAEYEEDDVSYIFRIGQNDVLARCPTRKYPLISFSNAM